jgi:hypothetical protein
VAGGKPRKPIPSTRRVRPGGKGEVSVDGFLTGRSSPLFIHLSFSGAVAMRTGFFENVETRLSSVWLHVSWRFHVSWKLRVLCKFHILCRFCAV